MILLEILIALFLVVIALFPLLYPHIGILREEGRLATELELYPKLSQIHADLLIDLHNRKYLLGVLKTGTTIPLNGLDLPFDGQISLKLDKRKKEGTPSSKYLLNIDYDLHRTDGEGRAIHSHYQLFLKGPAVTKAL
jgi:hypothetical protein